MGMDCCANGIEATAEGGVASAEKDQVLQAVQVAVHIRPLILQERIQGCKECVSPVPNEPQVQLGSHVFTFDHVYGSAASPPSHIFEECVAPLVDGLFHGYNATVLAYGQTGSGKTYTMGTGGNAEGIIRRVMETLFRKIEKLKDKADFQLRVSFIEILKEEIHDLLDTNPSQTVKQEPFVGVFGVKPCSPGKPPILIRETTGGGITLSSVTEIDVTNLHEMSSCLEQGSAFRATGSTNMNTHSSRSHAIFTITMEQRRRPDPLVGSPEDDYLSAKLHLVDLAGSERAKRTGTDGLRFKEGVHINKGLLALGNVISALGDDKKRKEGGHVPYRDSKLTRLLQDSLGGNSRTVMIACVSPADSNAEETLNTLKYANRARNIQNKPTVNRDPAAAELLKLRQQIEILQNQLLCAQEANSSDDLQILKQKVVWLEARNAELCLELQQSRDALEALMQQTHVHCGSQYENREGVTSQAETILANQVSRIKELETELQQLKARASQQTVQSCHPPMMSCMNGSAPAVVDLEIPSDLSPEIDTHAKELEHTILQDSLDKELQELNKKLAQKEAEMKSFTKSDSMVLKQHFERKLVELEEEKKALQRERDVLLAELENLATASDEQTHKMQDSYIQKLKELEYQIADLKKKQDNQSQLLKQKQRSDEAARRLHDEIHRIKQQKVQLQQKIKQESEQFRLWKAAREKELLQLRKEGRRNEYEMHKLRALHQHQKMVLQRKTEEAAIATRRLKEVLESRKLSGREAGTLTDNGHAFQADDKVLHSWVDREIEVALHVHEVRVAYDKQSEARTALANELSKLKAEEMYDRSYNAQNGNFLPMHGQIDLLENMLNASSDALVSMASELSEAEERELNGHARWLHLKTLGEAKALLNVTFGAAVCARCDLQDRETEIRELKDKIVELNDALKLSDARRQELDRQQRLKEQAVAVALAAATKAGADVAVRCGMEELSLGFSQLAASGSKHLQYTTNNSVDGSSDYDVRKLASLEPGLMTKQPGFQTGKLWKWKQSHQQRWSFHFKWKWQKPWRLSEWGMGKGATGYRFDVRHRDRWKRLRV
ncbi:kinesin-like protein KIN-4A isoform X1 [Selaginella moellendorffii]|uniref:kinesin-like protein KIN-4A isoform X1 n=1 Tax=Selaginella moellendorffii TaxID=88036 RepID=UPI000D1C2702|nr:kinesin-like protein KIN-4A isoform X1 [Selaginella moellendorffii]|eukprot:XP_024533405.1 kinesin-like protein KIN-4A isoform X1 [Selaginella moellendorffii]